MIGLFVSITLFNGFAIAMIKRLTVNQILHLWMFATSVQTVFDTYMDHKYLGYWYFTKEIDWISILCYTMLVQPIILIFLNYYPFGKSLIKKVGYFFFWEIGMLLYEAITLLPEPFGFFHYGWWNIGYSALLNPLLLILVLAYFKIIRMIERNLKNGGIT